MKNCVQFTTKSGLIVNVDADHYFNTTIVLLKVELPGIDSRITMQNHELRIMGGLSICTPKDEYNFDTGVRLAVRRALKIGLLKQWEDYGTKSYLREIWSGFRFALRLIPYLKE